MKHLKKLNCVVLPFTIWGIMVIYVLLNKFIGTFTQNMDPSPIILTILVLIFNLALQLSIICICTIYAVKNSFVEVQYPLNETSNITIRKSAGEEDISGVYDGKEMQLHSTDGVDVNVRLKDGKFISAYFTGDDGTYSITCDEPLEANEIIAIVDRIVSVNS